MSGIRFGTLLACLLLAAASRQAPLSSAPAAAPISNAPRRALDGHAEPRTIDGHGEPLPRGALARLGNIRLRHTGKVYQLAFTDGGRQLASLGEDNIFHVWETATGKERSRYTSPRFGAQSAIVNSITSVRAQMIMMQQQRHQQGLPALAGTFSPGGKLVAMGDQEDAVEVIDPRTGKQIRRFKMATGRGQHAVAFSVNGRLLAGVDGPGVVRVWDLATGKEAHQLLWPDFEVTRLTFSPDGAFLVGAAGHEICLWDLVRAKRVRRYEGHQGAVEALASSDDGKQLASGGADGNIRFWDLTSNEELSSVHVTNGPVQALAFNPDGKTLASGHGDSSLRLWDVATRREVRQLAGHRGVPTALAFSADGKFLASGSAGGRIRLWTTATGKEFVPVADASPVRSISFARSASDKGYTLVLGGEDRSVRFWDPDKAKLLRHRAGPKSECSTLAFAPSGNLLAHDQEDGVIHLWSPPLEKEIRRLEGHQQGVHEVGFSPDGAMLASSSPDGTIRLWRPATGQVLHQLEGTALVVPEGRSMTSSIEGFGLGFSADGKTLAAMTSEGRIRLWETATGKLRSHFPGTAARVGALVFSLDGRLLSSGTSDELIRVWDTGSGKLVQGLLGHQGTVNAVAFSPDGKQLASGGEDKIIRIWDLASGKEVNRFEGHQGAILSLAFAPGGKTLVSGSNDTTALIWDLSASAPAVRPAGHAAPPTLDDLWTDLAGDRGSAAFRAVIALSDRPESIAFLKERLKPAQPLAAREMGLLIAGLDDLRSHARDQASRALERLEGQAEGALRQALAKPASVEASRRIKLLLGKLNEPIRSAEGLRLIRAVEVLERMGSPKATDLLASLAKGAPGAELTRQAQAALGRLASRSGAKH